MRTPGKTWMTKNVRMAQRWQHRGDGEIAVVRNLDRASAMTELFWARDLSEVEWPRGFWISATQLRDNYKLVSP